MKKNPIFFYRLKNRTFKKKIIKLFVFKIFFLKFLLLLLELLLFTVQVWLGYQAGYILQVYPDCKNRVSRLIIWSICTGTIHSVSVQCTGDTCCTVYSVHVIYAVQCRSSVQAIHTVQVYN